MKLIHKINNKDFELIPSSELHQIRKITLYLSSIEKFKKCSRECPALKTLKTMIGGINEISDTVR
jgi:hypothetical protein